MRSNIATISALMLIAAVSVSMTLAGGGHGSPRKDTYMHLFDESGAVIFSDDNSSTLGNGWASGAQGIDVASGLIDNGDGTLSIRAGVTGRPDGLDGIFNGLFQNGPHGQFGRFAVITEYFDVAGSPVGSDSYTAEFVVGYEAFIINFNLPTGAVSANINIDNLLFDACHPGDINLDETVDAADLGILLGEFGLSGSSTADPDTYMILRDRGIDIVADDNGSTLGNGSASGLLGIDINSGIVDNNDGSTSIRAVITGASDATDGLVNGLFQNGPHGQIGRFAVVVDYFNLAGDLVGSDRQTGEFVSGSDMFFINFYPPTNLGVVSANIQIDNTLCEACPPGDINDDGVVDAADLGILLGAFGDVCEP